MNERNKNMKLQNDRLDSTPQVTCISCSDSLESLSASTTTASLYVLFGIIFEIHLQQQKRTIKIEHKKAKKQKEFSKSKTYCGACTVTRRVSFSRSNPGRVMNGGGGSSFSFSDSFSGSASSSASLSRSSITSTSGSEESVLWFECRVRSSCAKVSAELPLRTRSESTEERSTG